MPSHGHWLLKRGRPGVTHSRRGLQASPAVAEAPGRCVLQMCIAYDFALVAHGGGVEEEGKERMCMGWTCEGFLFLSNQFYQRSQRWSLLGQFEDATWKPVMKGGCSTKRVSAMGKPTVARGNTGTRCKTLTPKPKSSWWKLSFFVRRVH